MIFVNSSYIQQLQRIWMMLNFGQKYKVARYFMFPKVLEMLGSVIFCTFLHMCVKNLMGLVVMSTSVAFANVTLKYHKETYHYGNKFPPYCY